MTNKGICSFLKSVVGKEYYMKQDLLPVMQLATLDGEK